MIFSYFFAGECQRPRIIKEFNLANTNIRTIQSSRNFNTDEVIGAEFNYECALDYILFVSRDGGMSFQRSPTPAIMYECTFEAESYQSSINTNGIPSCKLLKICTCKFMSHSYTHTLRCKCELPNLEKNQQGKKSKYIARFEPAPFRSVHKSSSTRSPPLSLLTAVILPTNPRD